ncbi:MAG: hypothetical protein R3360_09795, partial [Alphaproteobacteria bacterium]|nr:hypothetical protein [Alphaproteobacteria bacterium]
AINHLEAHALSARLVEDVAFPYLLLLVSGGHCQLIRVDGVGRYQRLGTTIDDAVGEAFDKAAKLLGLGYPGGPQVEQAARTGDASRFELPRPLVGRPGCDFSFSGLKTALRREAEKLKAQDALGEQAVADLCAALQAAIGDVLVDRTSNAISLFEGSEVEGGKKIAAGPRAWGEGDRPSKPGMGRAPGREIDASAEPAASPAASGGKSPTLVLAGGVAANSELRTRLKALVEEKGYRLVCPPPALCTDNAAMIAWAGIERLALGLADAVSAPARARWPLDPDAPPAIGAGVKA